MGTARILLPNAVEGFLLARSADGYSQQTLGQYRWVLAMLANQVGDRPLEDVKADDLRRFLVWLKTDYKPKRKERLSDVSIFHAWKAIRALYKWASPELGIENVSLRISQPKHAYPEIVPFTEDDVKKLLRACDYKSGAPRQRRPTAVRDRAVVLSFLDTGIRVGELHRLNIEHANIKDGELYVIPHGSGYKSKGRVLPVGSSTQKALWKYLAGREAKPEDPLFVTMQGRRCQTREIQHFCKRLGKRAGVPSCHPHRFRHTFAIMYLRNKGDVFTLKRLLGHSSWRMVNHYLSLAQADIHAAHKRASPVDNINRI